MGAHNCTIGHHCCHVWVLGELLEHVGPNSVLVPACEALENAVPLAIPVWQCTPLGAGAQYPVNCLNETATLFLSPCVGTRVSLQKRVKFLPLIVGNLSCRHPAIVANVSEFIKCQRALVPLVPHISPCRRTVPVGYQSVLLPIHPRTGTTAIPSNPQIPPISQFRQRHRCQRY